MPVHSSYRLGTHTVRFEASELCGDDASAIKLSMGKACVLVSIALQPNQKQNPAKTRLDINFSDSSVVPSNANVWRPFSITDAEQRLVEEIRQVIHAVIWEEFVPRMRVMVRMVSCDPLVPSDVLVLQAVGLALHQVSTLNAPAIAAVRASCTDAGLTLMPGAAERSKSELHFLAVLSRSGTVILQAQGQDVPNALLVGAVAQAQARLLPVFQAIEASVSERTRIEAPSQLDHLRSKDIDQLDPIVDRAVRAASQFSSTAARRMALQAISARWRARQQAHGESDEHGQIECTLNRMVRTSLRQRILTSGKRLNGNAAGSHGLLKIELQSNKDGRQAVLLNSGRSQTSIVATPKCTQDRPDHDEKAALAFQDIFLQFDPVSRKQQEANPPSGTRVRAQIGPSDGFFQFVSMAVEPVMQPSTRVAAYSKPVLDSETALPASAMTGVGGACLAMLSAGTPIKAWVAGVDLGLVEQNGAAIVLVDPLPSEGALLDASLKVAGTYHGLTAVEIIAQTDGMATQALENALAQARDMLRSRIAGMRSALASATNLARESIPYQTSLNIDPSLTHQLMVRRRESVVELCESTSAEIRIHESGLVTITAPDGPRLIQASKRFNALVSDAIGKADAVDAVVVEVIEFVGVRVTTKDGKSAVLHTSRMTPGTLREGLEIGDAVKVLLLGRDVLGSYTAEMPAEAETSPATLHRWSEDA